MKFFDVLVTLELPYITYKLTIPLHYCVLQRICIVTNDEFGYLLIVYISNHVVCYLIVM